VLTGVRGARAECLALWTPAPTPAALAPAPVLSSQSALALQVLGQTFMEISSLQLKNIKR
jgi:hypothetical protein